MENQKKEIVRREFLSAATMSAMTIAAYPAALRAAEWTAQEKANVRVVTDFCAAWSTRDIAKPLALLADDCVYRMSETTPPANGHDGVIQRLKSYVDATDRLEFKIL